MNEHNEELYFEWLVDIVSTRTQAKRFSDLLRSLHEIEFVWKDDMDSNRAEDGIALRSIYEVSHDVFLDLERPCSVLEMMVGLSRRIEIDIMENDIFGDRTGEWFWSMIKSLGLAWMDNKSFDDIRFMQIMDLFLSRRYSQSGSGGLFYIPGCNKDMRKMEIWNQMNLFLSSID